MSCLRKASDQDGWDSNGRCCNSSFVGVQEIRDMGEQQSSNGNPKNQGREEEEEGDGQDVLRVAPLEKGGEREGSAGKFQERPPVGVKMTLLHCAVPCYLWKN